MNCMEAQALIEDELDASLAKSCKRALDLHLSRCATCAAFFTAEREERRRWFQAMNEPEARHRLPEGFADAFIAKMAAGHTHPQQRWTFVRAFRRIAAVLVVMLSFAGLSYAAVSVVERLSATDGNALNGDAATAQEGTQATEVTEAADGTEATAAAHVADYVTAPSVSIVPSISSTSSTKGGTTMKKGKVAASALSAAMAAAPLVAANGDEYQFIISGDPVAAATVGSSSDSSATTALMSGPLADGFVYVAELEARYRTMGESGTCSLRSDKAGTTISFR